MKAGSLEIEILTNLARVMSETAQIKRAMGGMVDSVGGGLDKARGSSERYLASLEKQAAAVGQTSEQIRRMEVAANAAAAEAQGFEDLAQKIRSVGAAIEQAKTDAAALAAQEAAAAQASREAAAAEAAHANALAALRGQVDPLAAEEARLAAQIDVANRAFARGEMGSKEYIKSITFLEGRMGMLKQAGGGVAASAGQQKAAMQQLSYQIGDVTQQFALGTPVMTIFAQQGGQVFQALGMMQKEAKGFIGFMGGPWGAVLMGAAMILGMLASKLLDNKSASEAAEKAMKTFQDRQSDIANFIDTTTGALKEQNKALVLNAILTRQANIAANEKAISDGRRKAFELADNLTKPGSQSGYVMGAAVGVSGLDPNVQRVIKLAQGDVAKLAEGLGNLARISGDKRYRDLALNISTVAGQAVIATRENEKFNRELQALGGNAKAYANSTTALIDRQVAAAVATTATEKAQARLNDVRARAQSIDSMTAGTAKDRALAQYRADLLAATSAERAAVESDKADKRATAAGASAQKHEEALARAAAKHEAALGREAAAMDASARSGMDLARAYLGVEGSAEGMNVALGTAIVAEARHRAVSDAVRKGISEEAQTRRVLANMVADSAVQAGKSINQMRVETGIRNDLNQQIEAGKISIGEYNEKLKQATALKPLIDLQAAAKAQGLTEAYDLLTRAIEGMTDAMDESHAAQAQAAFDAAKLQGDDEIERLKLEAKLIGASNEQRAVELAMLAKKQSLRSSDMTPEQQKALIDQAAEQARLGERNNVAQELHNRLLTEQLDILDALDQRARVVADSLADAFGRPGEAIGKLLTDFTGYAAERQRLQDQLDKQMLAAGASEELQRKARAEFDRNAATAEAQHYGQILSAAKGFFKEGTAGYKVMTTLEKVYSALQLANMIKAMVFDKVSTASSVGNSMVRGAADAAAGAAKIFSALGPLGFPVVAAMVAVLAGLGLRGIHGGGKGPSIPSAEDLQKSAGTGSVLGASDAKSDSIAKALDLVSKNTSKDLEYSNQMVRSLRSIDDNIGGLSGLIARQMGVSGGMFDSSGLGLGKSSGMNTIGLIGTGAFLGPIGLAAAGVLGIAKNIPIIGGVLNTIAKALFGTTKTVTLLDQGLNFANQTVQDIVTAGIDGMSYQTVQTVKKSKFLGISTGSKTSVSDQTAGLDGAMEQQISLLIASLRDGVVSAAGAIGIDGAAAMADAFQVSIGKISLKDLSSDEIEKQLQAIFSKVADDMAGSVVGGLSAFQKVGEGLFETLTRLARDYQVVDVSLQAIGMTFGAIGTASVGARENLIDLFGSLDAFADATSFFRDNFLSEAERMTPVIAAVSKQMASLGLSSVDTKDEFKQVVLGLDLSTEAGQNMFAALMAVAPAFAKVADYSASLTGALQDTAQTAQQLAEIAKQRRSLDIQLMDAQGRSEEALAAKRADELAALDPTLRALQQQVWTTQDAAAAAKDLASAQEDAAKAAEAIASKRHDLEIELMEAQGNAAGALAAKRADELAAMDESLRALQEQVWATQDAASATDALNQVQMTAADIAKTRRDLEIQLMEATGNAAGALAAKRADELAQLDPTLRALQEQVWAAQDAAEANQALANVQQTAAEIARTRRDLEIQLMEATGNAAGALAAKRADELAALDPVLHALQEQVWAAQDAAEANQALANVQQTAAEIARTRRDLEIQLMEATGNAAGALAAKRADELAALDPLLRALQEQVWAAQDAAEANQALADVQQTAAQIARTRRDLEIQLMEAEGNAAGALAAKRQDELAAIDPTLRALRQQVWATLDAADAARALADAQAESARVAEEAAAKLAELVRAHRDLEIRLMEAQGDAAGALAARREDEVAAADEASRGILQMIYAAEDLSAAAAAAAAAQEEAARVAEAAAQAQQALNDKRAGLEIDLLRATGHEMAAVALERQNELAQLDPSLRALQQQVWAAQDLQKAYDDQTSSIGDLRNKFMDFGKSLREYRASLMGMAIGGTEGAYAAASAQFSALAAKARLGDADALGGLQGAAQSFLEASKANARSQLDYRRDVGAVAAAVQQAIAITDSKVSEAELQLAAIAQGNDLLVVLNDSVLSVHDAIMEAAERGNAAIALPSSAYISSGAPAGSDPGAIEDKIQWLAERLEAPIAATAVNTKKVSDKLERWDNNTSMAVSTRDGETLKVDP